jgi:hypothetical protein
VNKSFKVKAVLAMATMLALPMAQAANVSKADYNAGKTRIDAIYTSDKAACNSLAGNAKDICVEEAKGREKVTRAELEYSYTGTPADANKIRVARAESAYEVAKERCDDLAGNAKDVCVKEAKAAHVKATADAKVDRVAADARKDTAEKTADAQRTAANDKNEANYKVALEKCDALAGAAKDTCVRDAKARFGKS